MACPEQPDHPGHTAQTIPPEVVQAFEVFAASARLFAEQFAAQVMPTIENAAKAACAVLRDLPAPAE